MLHVDLWSWLYELLCFPPAVKRLPHTNSTSSYIDQQEDNKQHLEAEFIQIYLKKTHESRVCVVFSRQKPNLVSLPFNLEQQKKVWHMEESREGIFRTG